MVRELHKHAMRLIVGGAIGAGIAAALILTGPLVLPPSVFSFVEYVMWTPAKVMMLPVILITNCWLSPSGMTSISFAAWAIVGALMSVVLHRMRKTPLAVPRNGRKITGRTIIISFGMVILSVVAFVTLWIAFVLLGFVGSIIGRSALESLTSPSLYQVHHITGVEFPKSARLLYSDYEVWQGTELFAKFEIDRADVDKFLWGFPGVSSTDRMEFDNWKEVSWWDPDSWSKFKAVKCEYNQGGELKIFVGLDDDKRVSVYLFYWGKT
ncbi:hypothetical protein LLG38_08485 [bacterium]|nr:hypothetical protein [bacterium]